MTDTVGVTRALSLSEASCAASAAGSSRSVDGVGSGLRAGSSDCPSAAAVGCAEAAPSAADVGGASSESAAGELLAGSVGMLLPAVPLSAAPPSAVLPPAVPPTPPSVAPLPLASPVALPLADAPPPAALPVPLPARLAAVGGRSASAALPADSPDGAPSGWEAAGAAGASPAFGLAAEAIAASGASGLLAQAGQRHQRRCQKQREEQRERRFRQARAARNGRTGAWFRSYGYLSSRALRGWQAFRLVRRAADAAGVTVAGTAGGLSPRFP